MSPRHDEPKTGIEDFDPKEDDRVDTWGLLDEVFAEQKKLHVRTLKNQKALAEVLLAQLEEQGSSVCAGCQVARKVAEAFRETAIDQIETATGDTD